MVFRTMCSSCGHTYDDDNLTTSILDLRHDISCDCFMGMPISYIPINLDKIKQGNPKYFEPYQEGVGLKSNERASK